MVALDEKSQNYNLAWGNDSFLDQFHGSSSNSC